MHETIRQEVRIDSPPRRVYDALTRGSEFSAATGGAPAEIEPIEGSPFSCFGGMIHGRMIELEPPRRIVQAWRVKSWEAGVYSVARFELAAEGAGTRIVFEHAAFPAAEREHLAAGWEANYWSSLRRYLESSVSPA